MTNTRFISTTPGRPLRGEVPLPPVETTLCLDVFVVEILVSGNDPGERLRFSMENSESSGS